MGPCWEASLDRLYDEAFGHSSRKSVDRRAREQHFGYLAELRHHLRLLDQVFDTVALALHVAPVSGQSPNAARRVSELLATQIAQDIKAVRLLVSAGFPYQAVTVSVSSFEHSWMLASIGSDAARAQQWLDHPEERHNISNVKDTIRLGMEKLEQDFPGIKLGLGDPYVNLYGPLCTFKHGNPSVQQHMLGKGSASLPLSIFTALDRRATVAAFWALESAIRSGWLALIVFAKHQIVPSDELKGVIRGINESSNGIRKFRIQKEQEPN